MLFSNIVSVGGEDKTELKSTHFSDRDSKSIFTTSFNELDPDQEYEICVSTNYNGQEVAKSMTKILRGMSIYTVFFSVISYYKKVYFISNISRLNMLRPHYMKGYNRHTSIS